MTPDNRTLALTALVVLSFMGVAAQPVTAYAPTEPAVIVDLQADGTATFSVRSTFDLTTNAERDAFRSLMEDEEAQQNAKDRFLTRIRTVARDAENATGRDMAVTGATIKLRRSSDNATGIVTLSVTWKGLAAVDGETLRVSEPFASGFSPDRAVIIRAPDGYTFASVSPEPDERGAAKVSWEAGSDLTGLAVELEPEATPTPTPTPTPTETETQEVATETGGQPGFGWLVALLGILGTAGLVSWRRKRR